MNKMKYALVEDSTKVILKEVDGNKRFRTGIPPTLPLKPFHWLPIEITKPDIPDHATHTREGPVITVEADKVTKVWTVNAKTEQELDAELAARKENRIPRSSSVEFKAMLDIENRTLALEGKPAVTELEYRETLKAML